MKKFLLPLIIMILCIAGTAFGEEISYKTPPKCLIWMQGEDCTDHNWIEGPSYHSWIYEWTPIHGGVLDLASWRLPKEGEYYARFKFNVPETGEYVVYFLGRHGVMASPFEWSVDNGKPVEIPGGIYDIPGTLALTNKYKHVLLKLGTFNGNAGTHTLKISVKKTVDDWGHSMFSQQIDAIGIAPASWTPEAATPPAPKRPGTGNWAPPGRTPAHPTLDNSKRPSIKLISKMMECEISPVNGGIRKFTLRNGLKRTVLASSKLASAFLKVDFRDNAVQDSGRVEHVNTTKNTVTLYCTNKSLKTRIHFWARPSGEIAVSADITNLAKSPIWRTDWQVSSGIGINGDTSNDTWHVAQSVDSPQNSIGLRKAMSPRSFAFDWMCMTDDTASFYAMFEDRKTLDTEITYGREAKSGSTGTVVFSKFPRILTNQVWEAPSLVFGAYAGGDWHKAADKFSTWWYSWAKTPAMPNWVKSIGGMTLGMSFYEDNALQSNKAMLEKTRLATDISWYHGAGWIRGTTECWYPEQMYPSNEEIRSFRQVTDDMRQNGGRSSIYTNTLMLSRATSEYELWGRDLTTTSFEGDPWFSEHDAHHHPMALPYPNEVWAERYCQIMEKPVMMGRPDMLYMDQLGAVPSHIDFDPDKHHHKNYGEWTTGSAKFLEVVRKKFVGSNKDLATCIETPNPVLMQQVNLSISGTNEVFRYVFPTYYGLYGGYEGVDAIESLKRTRGALLTGEPVLLVDSVQANAIPDILKKIHEIVALKRKVDPLLYEARYRENEGLRVSGGIQASVFKGKDRVYIAFAGDSTSGSIVLDMSKLGLKLKGKARLAAAGSDGEFVAIQLTTKPGGIFEYQSNGVHAGIVEIR